MNKEECLSRIDSLNSIFNEKLNNKVSQLQIKKMQKEIDKKLELVDENLKF